jgi:alpha-amylase
MSRLALALALHNHQPVGNFAWVFERAYRRAYEPMVAALERHPGVRLALHYSGPLLDWLLAEQPGFIARVRALVARGQVEIMTGGYYEPILPAIPDRDKRGQILKMTDAVRRHFGTAPTGAWLAERVWEPHLPKSLARAGVAYTIADDTHFLHVGLEEQELRGHYITEEEGARLAVLSSAKALRYRIPWASVDEVMAWLRAQAADAEGVLVMGDDGEKFGLWPTTYAHVWERGWVEAFFGALEAAGDWLEVLPPGEWVRTRPPRGRVYLPTASYDEMTEWALPPRAAARLPALKHELAAQGRRDVVAFLHGGFWRHFLVKYPEVNAVHKQMLRASRKVWRMPPGPRRDRALDHLWQAQCNCPYWHGVFGGVYLGHIRAATAAHLIAAEHLADAMPAAAAVRARREDLDADGRPEVLVASGRQVLSIDPDEGGSVVTWDLRGARVNLVNVMTRRTEGYHETLRAALARGEAVLSTSEEVESIHTDRVRVREWGLERLLIADRYRRASFVDHLLAAGAEPQAFARGEAAEVGAFAGRPYRAAIGRAGRRGVAVRLSREGTVEVGGTAVAVRVQKTLTVPAGATALEAAYEVTNAGAAAVVADFAVETCWATTGPDALVVPIAGAGTGGAPGAGEPSPAGQARQCDDASGFALTDPLWRATATVDTAGARPRLWVAPIEVVSASEAGFVRTFQGVSLILVWPLRLEAGARWTARLSFSIDESERASGQ